MSLDSTEIEALINSLGKSIYKGDDFRDAPKDLVYLSEIRQKAKSPFYFKHSVVIHQLPYLFISGLHNNKVIYIKTKRPVTILVSGNLPTNFTVSIIKSSNSPVFFNSSRISYLTDESFSFSSLSPVFLVAANSNDYYVGQGCISKEPSPNYVPIVAPPSESIVSSLVYDWLRLGSLRHF